jgi:hypothetical protein
VVPAFDVDMFLSVQLLGISTMRYVLGRGDGKPRRILEDNVNKKMGIGWTWLKILSKGQ